jgi:SAM-dependent methyltransferase
VYDVLADHYDRFTAHHDYELWMGRLLGLARANGLRGVRALDAGCGTGKSIEPLLRRGFEVTGCDLSQGMLDVAAVKLGARVALRRCDLRSLPELGCFDLVTCLDDVLNYLTDPAALGGALAGLRRNMAPGGLLLFDANTLATYRGFFRATEVVEGEASVLIWRGEAPVELGPGELARARLDIFERRDGRWVRSTSHHEQRHHPEQLVRAAIEGAGLSLLGVWGQDPAVNLDPRVDELRHTKAIYLATRPG